MYESLIYEFSDNCIHTKVADGFNCIIPLHELQYVTVNTASAVHAAKTPKLDGLLLSKGIGT